MFFIRNNEEYVKLLLKIFSRITGNYCIRHYVTASVQIRVPHLRCRYKLLFSVTTRLASVQRNNIRSHSRTRPISFTLDQA